MAAAAGVALVASLPREAVADYWPAVALGIWFLSAAVTGRVLSLPVMLVLFGALAGAVAGGIVDVVAHSVVPPFGAAAGMAVGVLVFAASSAGYDDTFSE
jgi:hypothetical protein